MGILNIVFGSLFLLCTVCGGALLLMMLGNSSMFQIGGVNPVQDMWDFVKREIPAYPAIAIGSLVAGLVLNALLLISGIGLLNMQNWARVLALIYSVITIIEQIGSLIFTIAYVNPVMTRWEADFHRRFAGRLPPGGMGGGDSAFQNLTTVAGAILGMVYAIVLLVMMLRPSVAAAFGTGPPPEEPLADRYGEGGDEYERRRDPWNY
jgi:hypothetical protein